MPQSSRGMKDIKGMSKFCALIKRKNEGHSRYGQVQNGYQAELTWPGHASSFGARLTMPPVPQTL